MANTKKSPDNLLKYIIGKETTTEHITIQLVMFVTLNYRVLQRENQTPDAKNTGFMTGC
jgi:hypothetical protein